MLQDIFCNLFTSVKLLRRRQYGCHTLYCSVLFYKFSIQISNITRLESLKQREYCRSIGFGKFLYIPVSFRSCGIHVHGTLRISNNKNRIRRKLSTWTKHGYICLSLPDFHPVIDVAIYMDVSVNPGPYSNDTKTRISSCQVPSAESPYYQSSNRLGYSRNSLLALRSQFLTSSVDKHIFEDLKRSGLFRYRAGKYNRKYNRNNQRAITTVITRDRARIISARGRVYSNLIPLVRTPFLKPAPGEIATDKFAVPKCMFLNICSLTKVKKKVKASVALETDLYARDIDLCVICETHLKKITPDSVVNISNYTLYRRDRCNSVFGPPRTKSASGFGPP